MIRALFITLALFFAGCISKNATSTKGDSTQEIARQPAQVEVFDKDSLSKDICFNALLDRSIWSQGIPTEGDVSNKPLIKIEDLISNKFPTTQKINILEEFILEKYKNKSIEMNWGRALMPLTSEQYPVKKSELSDYIKRLQSLPVETIGQKNKCLEQQKIEFKAGLSQEQQGLLTLACAKLALGDAIRCQSGVNFLYKEAAPSTKCGNAMTYPTVWSNILTDSKYFSGIKISADNLSTQIRNKKVTSANLLSSLEESFSASGKLQNKEVSDAAWDTLAIISNGAQNTNTRVTDFGGGDSIRAQLEFLSFSAGIIDFENLKFNGSFSLPHEITGNCLTTKPYHFWMAAYQARSLIKEKYSQREAMMAVLTYAKAYNIQGYKGYEKLAMLFEKPWNHPTISVVRHDLILNVLGAAYGAGLLEGKHVNIEIIFEKVFAARSKDGNLDYKTEAVPLAQDKLKSFMFWEKMFNPNGIFKIVEQEMKNAK